MLNLTLNELRLVAKNGGIKGYKNMSKDKLLIMLYTPEPIKEKKTIKDIIKENSNTDEIFKDKKLLFEPELIKIIKLPNA